MWGIQSFLSTRFVHSWPKQINSLKRQQPGNFILFRVKISFTILLRFSYIWFSVTAPQHNGPLVTTVASQHEGHGFDSESGRFCVEFAYSPRACMATLKSVHDVSFQSITGQAREERTTNKNNCLSSLIKGSVNVWTAGAGRSREGEQRCFHTSLTLDSKNSQTPPLNDQSRWTQKKNSHPNTTPCLSLLVLACLSHVFHGK